MITDEKMANEHIVKGEIVQFDDLIVKESKSDVLHIEDKLGEKKLPSLPMDIIINISERGRRVSNIIDFTYEDQRTFTVNSKKFLEAYNDFQPHYDLYIKSYSVLMSLNHIFYNINSEIPLLKTMPLDSSNMSTVPPIILENIAMHVDNAMTQISGASLPPMDSYDPWLEKSGKMIGKMYDELMRSEKYVHYAMLCDNIYQSIKDFKKRYYPVFERYIDFTKEASLWFESLDAIAIEASKRETLIAEFKNSWGSASTKMRIYSI